MCFLIMPYVMTATKCHINSCEVDRSGEIGGERVDSTIDNRFHPDFMIFVIMVQV